MTSPAQTETDRTDAATQPSEGIPNPYADRPTVAELKKVRKVYYKPDGSVMVEALRGVDITVHQGEYVAIMGASGSGKSTLMNILGCLDQPTDGQYLLAGKDINEMDDEALSQFRGRTIGFVFQAFNLIPQLTVEDNVAVPLFYQGVDPIERRERAIEKLSLVGLGERLGHRPRELSGGQQQRVAIARSLIAEPKVLMADEPTGNLDSRTGEEILTLFEKLHAGGMSILMVTHDDSVADRCERVIRLKDGVVEWDRRLRTRAVVSSKSPSE
ncbi:MAG: ABC transporter ATP-binding protein [Phycisphaerales bacterium]|jgi:putative ABC transport system ATP-binding protein